MTTKPTPQEFREALDWALADLDKQIAIYNALPHLRTKKAALTALRESLDAEPVALTTERHIALREGHMNTISALFWSARAAAYSPETCKAFDAGFTRGFDSAANVYAVPPAAPSAQGSVPACLDGDRFCVDHKTIHDRATGKHITADELFGPSVVAESLATLNGLHRALTIADEILSCDPVYDAHYAESKEIIRTVMLASAPPPPASAQDDARDAARYRFIRSRVGFDRGGYAWLPCGRTKVDPKETDVAIDAALSDNGEGT